MKRLLTTALMLIAFSSSAKAQISAIIDKLGVSMDATYISGFIGLCETATNDGNGILNTLLGDFSDYTENIQNGIEQVNDIVKLYTSSKEVIAMSEYVYQIYNKYFIAVGVVVENSAILSEDEVEGLIKVLDYAAFRKDAVVDDGSTRGLDNIAGGAYLDFLTLVKSRTDGSSEIELKTIITEQREAYQNIKECYADVVSFTHYIDAALYRRKYELGMIETEKIMEVVKSDWEKGIYYHPNFDYSIFD